MYEFKYDIKFEKSNLEVLVSIAFVVCHMLSNHGHLIEMQRFEWLIITTLVHQMFTLLIINGFFQKNKVHQMYHRMEVWVHFQPS